MKLLKKLFIKDYEKTADAKVRLKYGTVASIGGLIINVVLFLLKITVGVIGNSITIIADAINNLSDAGSSAVTLVGFRLSGRPADKEHPFGHARYEYITALIVAMAVFAIGLMLGWNSVEKIFSPEEVTVSVYTYIILGMAVLAKLFQMWLYSDFGKSINSLALQACAKDSRNDVISTLAVIATTVIMDITGVNIDGFAGVAVSAFIIISSIKLIGETINPLLGTLPDKQTVNSIREIISSDPHIVGVHDLIVHDYGPGRVMASVHAEVADDAQIIKIHEIIDALEKKVENDVGVHMVIHMDPISVDCERTNSIKNEVISVIKSIDSALNIHDFRMTDGVNNINLIFDLEVPSDFTNSEKLPALIDADLKKINPCYTSVINMDIVYE